MFWIKLLFALAILLLVLVLGTEIFFVNTQPVQFDYVLGRVEWPLSVVIVSAFAVGTLVAILVSLMIILPLRWRVTRLKRTLAVRDRELSGLLKKASQGVRQA